MIQEEIILKYLNNQCSAEELSFAESWIAKNPRDFKLTEDIYNESSQAKGIKLFNVDTEWTTFMELVDSQESKSTDEAKVIPLDNSESRIKPVSLWKELRPAMLAASMLLLVISAYFLWPRNEITHLAQADGLNLELPDNTKVTLQEGASLTYPRTFENKNERVVILDGIATFDVTPNPNKPFIVQTALAGVQALGTVYEVNALDPSVTSVKNIEGLINFFDVQDTSKAVKVNEGESFSYDGSAFTETTPLPEPKELTFEFKEVKKLYSVREIVNRIYTLSNGHAVPNGDNFDWNKRIPVDINTKDLKKLLNEIQNKASVTLIKTDCEDCYIIKSFRVRNNY
jgi:hypothetical protein